MRMIYGVAATAICLAAGVAFAQQQGGAQNGASTNPFARTDKFSFFGNLQGPLNSQGFARPQPHVSPVTPVPEPSEWALMAAGLALVGYIVRRSSKRRD
jgi:uncharacterized protein YdeI (BOF family)